MMKGAHNRVRRRLLKLRLKALLTLKALDVLPAGHHIGLHLVVGCGILGGELSLRVGVLVEERLCRVPELRTLVDVFLNLACH